MFSSINYLIPYYLGLFFLSILFAVWVASASFFDLVNFRSHEESDKNGDKNQRLAGYSRSGRRVALNQYHGKQNLADDDHSAGAGV